MTMLVIAYKNIVRNETNLLTILPKVLLLCKIFQRRAVRVCRVVT